jgi:hypothetical protein
MAAPPVVKERFMRCKIDLKKRMRANQLEEVEKVLMDSAILYGWKIPNPRAEPLTFVNEFPISKSLFDVLELASIKLISYDITFVAEDVDYEMKLLDEMPACTDSHKIELTRHGSRVRDRREFCCACGSPFQFAFTPQSSGIYPVCADEEGNHICRYCFAETAARFAMENGCEFDGLDRSTQKLVNENFFQTTETGDRELPPHMG